MAGIVAELGRAQLGADFLGQVAVRVDGEGGDAAEDGKAEKATDPFIDKQTPPEDRGGMPRSSRVTPGDMFRKKCWPFGRCGFARTA